jgi:plasmid stability protein
MATDAQDRTPRRPFFIRCFPEDLRRQLAVEAKAAERSVAAEAVFRLRRSLAADDEAATA